MDMGESIVKPTPYPPHCKPYEHLYIGVGVDCVESILIGYNVLMITNLSDEYTWVSWSNRLQIGLIVDYAEWLQLRTGWDMRSRHWPWLEEQDKISCLDKPNCWFQEQSKNKNHRWSEEQHKIGWQPMHVDFKLPRSVSRIFVFLLFISF